MDSKRIVRYYWLKMLRLQDSPERIAFGVSVGVFINFSPLLGFHTLMALAAFFLLPINRFSTIVTVWANTPWTVPFLMGLDYKVGSWMLGVKVQWHTFNFNSFSSLISLGQEIFCSLLAGGTLLGLLCAVAVYYPSLYLIKLYQHRRRTLLLSP